MQTGIFAKTFLRRTLEITLDAVRAHGLRCVQFNMGCVGLPTLPDRIDPALCDRIRNALGARGISMGAVSGTFNMIHPVIEQRELGLERLGVLAGACRGMGTSVITLCTGTRDPENMWRRHSDNDTPAVWKDLMEAMQRALEITEQTGVTLAFEPEVANVVDSAKKARRVLDEVDSPRLKVVMDPANLFHKGELARQREILDEAFGVLGPDIVLAHAKDLSHDGDAGHEAAGKGLLDYDCYLNWLRRIGYDGPLILHGLEESQVDECVAFLRGKMKSC